MLNWVPNMYMGKPEIPVRTSNGARHSVRTVSRVQRKSVLQPAIRQAVASMY